MSVNLYHINSPEIEKAFEAIFHKAISLNLIPADSTMSCSFVSPEEIHQFNKDFRGIDRPTDVLSFAMREGQDFESVPDFDQDDQEDEAAGLEQEVSGDEMEEEVEVDLGDIFINTRAIEEQAKEYGHSPFREACFLFAHGLLHLAGYDHQNEKEESEMRKMQRELLLDVAGR